MIDSPVLRVKPLAFPRPRRGVGVSTLRAVGVLASLLAGLPQALAAEPAGNVVRYRVVGDGIPASLTRVPGDPQRGRAAAVGSTRGNCLLCHSLPIPEIPVFGNVGPPLDQVGLRLGEAQLRLRLVDGRKLNPQSVMPAYYKVEGLRRVAAKHRDQPVLSAQEIEDIVAYLLTLR